MIKFDELRRFYNENYSLGYINNSHNLADRLALISLICYVTYKSKLKNPDTTHYMIIMKISKNLGLPDEFIKGLAIVCEDLSYDCTEFPTFGLKGREIVNKIVEILRSYVPF